MCVIVANKEGKVPSLEDLRAMQSFNPDGIGLAWRSDEEHAIRFEKGITFERMQQLLTFIAGRKIPYVLHFRITTAGGEGPRFCHPWPITNNTAEIFALSGTSEAVLCHNGTWSDWYKVVPNDNLLKKMIKYDWSDTAAMAFMAGKCEASQRIKKFCGAIALGTWGQRVCVLSYSRGLQFFGRFELADDIYYSNLFWQGGSVWYEKWYKSDGPFLAARPKKPHSYAKYSSYTACDLEAMRRSGRISKRRYKKLMRILARRGVSTMCDNANSDKYGDYADSADYYALSKNVGTTNVWCENCGMRFPATTMRCPACQKGDGIYTHNPKSSDLYMSLDCSEHKHSTCQFGTICCCSCHLSGVNKLHNIQMDTSLACEDNRHDDCNWSRCKCKCHALLCLHNVGMDDYCHKCAEGSDIEGARPIVLSDGPKQPSRPPMTHILTDNTGQCMHKNPLTRPCSQCELALSKDPTKWPTVVSQPMRGYGA